MAVYKGNSGESGTSGTTASHDSELVRVVKEHKKPRRKYTVVCPHAGKAFCWTDFVKSLHQLPIEKAHVLLYDNSTNAKQMERLVNLTKDLPSFTLIQDLNPPSTIEITKESDRLIDRCCQVYEEIYERYVPKTDFYINLEDDIGIPDGGFERLEWVLGDQDVGTVIGDCIDRRRKVYEDVEQSIVCNFIEQRQIGGLGTEDVLVEMVDSRPSGIEHVGAGHMGLWLTRREAIEATGMKTDLQSRDMGQDIQYGLRLNRAGWRFAVRWDVKLRHFYKDTKTRRKMSVI
jgi:hypothetical protein